jgi:hypothetical protein
MAHKLRRMFRPGDHICVIYSDTQELADIAADFLCQGLKKQERCWYVAARDERDAVASALRKRGVKVDGEMRRGALDILDGSDAYIVRGDFNPEETVGTFSDAIEAALKDGFSGFRAAADMSWALSIKNGPQRAIAYEVLLRTLFATARATGLCLYDRKRMPLQVLDGALVTHPFAGVNGHARSNPFYDSGETSLADRSDDAVASRLNALKRPARRARGH